MSRSRADQIVADWKIVAEHTSRPRAAPRSIGIRSAMPTGILVLGIAVVSLVAIIGPRWPGTSVLSGAAPGSAQASAMSPTERSTTPTADASGSGLASPLTSLPAEAPSSAEVAAAKAAVQDYTAALVRGDFPAAYRMLAPESQAHWQSLANYTGNRRAAFKEVNGRYSVSVPAQGLAPLESWLPATYGASIDPQHAVIVRVDYPSIAAYNAFDVYVVTDGPDGLKIFDVR